MAANPELKFTLRVDGADTATADIKKVDASPG